MNGRVQIAAARRYMQMTPMGVSATEDRELQVRIRCPVRLEGDPNALVRPWQTIAVTHRLPPRPAGVLLSTASPIPASRGDLTLTCCPGTSVLAAGGESGVAEAR